MEQDKAMEAIDFTVNLPSIRKIIRQPSQLKIDYDIMAALCAIGAPMSECAFVLGTTTTVLDLKIRKDLKMTFHEFQNYYASYKNIKLRRAMIKKALDGHWPTMQWLSINELGMSKDGMMNKDPSAENSQYTDEELMKMLEEPSGRLPSKTQDYEQCKNIAGAGDVQGKPGDSSTRVHSTTDKGHRDTGCSDQGRGDNRCKKTSQPQKPKQVQENQKKNPDSQEKIK